MTHKEIVSRLEGILRVLIPIADRVGLNEIRLSKTAAKELLREIKALNKKI